MVAEGFHLSREFGTLGNGLMLVHCRAEATMSDMGTFYTTIELAPLDRPDARHRIDAIMVDTGAEYSWLPADLLADIGIVPTETERFELADGRIIERMIGEARIFAGGRAAYTFVTFGEPGDKVLLGAYALEGLRLKVDLYRRELVRAGPAITAAA